MTHNDDQTIGQILTRREALAFLGIVSAAMLASCAPAAPAAEPTARPSSTANPPPTSLPVTQSAAATALQPTATGGAVAALPACVVRPAMTEGPYFVDEKLNRSDIRSDPADNSMRDGAPLKLVFRVSRLDSASCAVLKDAVIDVWHCDAEGQYSDVEAQKGKKFLRGYQVTDSTGLATFTTIYPGWYQGRATHIHFKIRNDPSQSTGWDFTSQLFFDDSMNDQVYALAPYASRGPNTTRNAQDGIYQAGGDQMLLQPSRDGEGYTAAFDIGLQLS